MTSNEKLAVAYTAFCIWQNSKFNAPGELRQKFSRLLGLPVTDTGRTPTLDKWLLPSDSQNHRTCPEPVARYAQVAVVLARNMSSLEAAQPLQDPDFFLIKRVIEGE